MALGSDFSPGCIGAEAARLPFPHALPHDAPDHLRLALDLSPVPAMVTAPDGRIRMTNTALDRLFGYPPGGLIGLPLETLVPAGRRRRHNQHYRAFFRAPVSRAMGIGMDLCGQRADGSLFPVEVGLSLVEGEKEALTYVTVLDISLHTEGEKRLREALDASACAMLLIADDERIELVNSSACTLLGGTMERLRGMRLEAFLPQRSLAALSLQRPGTASGWPSVPEGRILDVRSLDGREFPMQVTLTPIGCTLPESQTVIRPRIMATLVDMSAFIAQQRELKRRNDDLGALNDELTQFAYSASHDLRAPLSTIAGLLELCLEDFDGNDLAECRRNISAALSTSKRNIHKVEAVLTLARAGLNAVPVQQIDLLRAIPACWDRLRRTCPDMPAFTLCIDGTARLRTEATTLMTAIEQLLANACHFQAPNRHHRWVSVRVRSRPEEVAISVADNGLGILENEQLRVFEIFRRSANSTGHGLGLPLVQKHVRRLGGAIALSSSPEGTNFVLTFPGMEIVE